MSAKYRFPGGTAEEIHLALPSSAKRTLGGSPNTARQGWQWRVRRTGMVDYLPFQRVPGDEAASAMAAWAVLGEFLGDAFQDLEEVK